MSLQDTALRDNLEGQTLRIFLKKMLDRFDQLPSADKKRAVQGIIRKVIVREDRRTLELHVNLSPSQKDRKIIIHGEPPGDLSLGAHIAEYKSSGFTGDGGPQRSRTAGLYNAIVALYQLS